MGRNTVTGTDRAGRRRARAGGFTMIELLVVVSLVIILASIGMAQYKNGVVRAQEAVLKENLFRMRDVIDQFYADKQKYPQTLEELVDGRIPAGDPEGPVHRLRGDVADCRGRARSGEPGDRTGHRQRQERVARSRPSTAASIRSGRGSPAVMTRRLTRGRSAAGRRGRAGRLPGRGRPRRPATRCRWRRPPNRRSRCSRTARRSA